MALSSKRRPGNLADVCRKFAFFKGVGEEALTELTSRALCHDYPKNNILCYRGDPTAAVFLVISGRVKIILTSDEGREVIVSILGPGGLFGLTSSLDGGDQLAEVVTVEPSRIARFETDAFRAWSRRPEVQAAVIRELTGRVRGLHQKIGEHALLGAKERLLLTLLEIAEDEGEQDPRSAEIIFTRPTHQELAHRIGSSREVVSRLLAELLESDLLRADEGRVIRVTESALILREE